MVDGARIERELGPPIRRARECVLRGWVGHQGHSLRKAVYEYACNQRPFFIEHGFALDYGGDGTLSSITGSSLAYGAGAGGGAGATGSGGVGGSSGVGAAGGSTGNAGANASPANRGSGGGGAGGSPSGTVNGGNGSDGVVIVRTLDTVATATTTGSPTVTTAGGYKVYLFDASGTITF